MANEIYNDFVTGMGETDIGNNQICYMFVHVTDTGSEVHRLTPRADLDRYARLGFVTFGTTNHPGGDIERTFWRAPIWLEFLDLEWTPTPQYFGGDLTIWASKFRWSLAPGAEAHVWIYGFP